MSSTFLGWTSVPSSEIFMCQEAELIPGQVPSSVPGAGDAKMPHVGHCLGPWP